MFIGKRSIMKQSLYMALYSPRTAVHIGKVKMDTKTIEELYGLHAEDSSAVDKMTAKVDGMNRMTLPSKEENAE